MTGLFLQCRLDSSRLPGKALLPLGNVPLISRVMEALAPVDADFKVLLTTEDSQEGLLPTLGTEGFSLYTGSKEDVLDRFIKGAEHFGVDHIIRATGDNPFVSAQLANELLADHLYKEADYSGFLGMPLGTGVEILRVSALQQAAAESDKPFDHEHVAPYLYNNPNKFKINRPSIKHRYGFESLKISVDTQADLNLAQRILSEVGSFPIEIDQLMEWVKGEYSE